MKKKIIISLLLILSVLFMAACSAADSAAIVNGEKISTEDLEMEVALFQENIANSGLSIGDPEDEEYQRILKEEVLNIMIREVLLHQELVANDIEITEDGAIEYLDGMKSMYGEEQYQALLSMNGVDEDTFIEDFAFNEALTALREKVTADVVVSEEETKEYFEANKSSLIRGTASHILFSFSPEEATDEVTEEMQARFDEALARLSAGEDFATVAQEMSDDGSAANGGKLEDSFSMIDSPYVDEFTVAALNLEAGEYTEEPVVTQFGYHLIKLDEKIDDFDSLKTEITSMLLENKKDEVFGDYVLQLNEKAEIENFVSVEEPEVDEES